MNIINKQRSKPKKQSQQKAQDLFKNLSINKRNKLKFKSIGRKVNMNTPIFNFEPSRVLKMKKSRSKKQVKRLKIEKEQDKPENKLNPDKNNNNNNNNNNNEIEQILQTFSIYSKVNDRMNPMNDISLSTINTPFSKDISIIQKQHSDNFNINQQTNFSYNKSSNGISSMKIEPVIRFTLNNKSNHNVQNINKEVNSIIDTQKSKLSLENIDKLFEYYEHAEELEKKNNSNLINNQEIDLTFVPSLESLKKNCPKKYNQLFDKLINKIKKFENNNQCLERQLRNRNKDYLYALKAIESLRFNV
jgi:hypothetical protein